MRKWPWLLIGTVLFAACGKDDGGGTAVNNEPAVPKEDPAVVAQRKADAKQKREEAAAKKKEARAKAKLEIAKLETELAAMQKRHKEEADALPDQTKLRNRLRGMIADARNARSIYEANKRRFDELEKVVAGSATAEIKTLNKQLAAKEKNYWGVMSGAKEARANERLGIMDETQVQKEIRTLRAAKKAWFEMTRDTRRGTKAAGSGESSKYKSWLAEEPLRKSVVAKALPDGKTTDSFNFANLDFFVMMELLEDSLDRKNVAAERKELSAADKVLAGLEKELDALRQSIDAKMTAGGGDMEEFTAISATLKTEKKDAEDLERQMAGMRTVYNEIDELRDRHSADEEKLDNQITALKKKLR